MKIIQVIGGGEKGGSRSYIIELCLGLINEGHETEIVCFLEDVVARSAREHEIPVAFLPMGNIFDLRAVIKLVKHIRQYGPDLVHTHGVRANFIGRLAAKYCRVPVVTTVHSSIYQDYSNPLKKLIYHRIEKLTRRFTDRFIAVVGSLKDELQKDGIDAERINVVFNGLSPNFKKEIQGPSLREELDIPLWKPILMTIGRMEKVKNQHMFLKICAFIKNRGTDFHAVLVGDGPLFKQLQDSAAELGLSDSVSFLGFRRDIFRLLTGADLFILTSRMEGLPITLLEAMAAGTPVVCTQVGGMPEVIRLAKNGWTVEENDVDQFTEKVLALLENHELRKEMAYRGKVALGKYFSSTSFIAGTIAVYSQALRGDAI